jgi:deoxyribonuclease V
MKLAIDVGYYESGAIAAGVLFNEWTDSHPEREVSTLVREIADYEPGQFYKRELPCMLALLAEIECELDAIVVDGYVWLGKPHKQPKPGLGAYLFEHLKRKVPIIGVAKNEFAGSGAPELLRGDSKRPLFITAAGVELPEAIHFVKQMHGKHRFPTLLKRVDILSRTELEN